MRPKSKKPDENRPKVGNQLPPAMRAPPPTERRGPSQRTHSPPLSDRGRTLRDTKAKQLLSNKPGRSKLPHDAPMGKGDIYFALDCEMVGVGPDGSESALARVVIVNWDEDVVLDTFVKPPVPVTDYRTFVSGVRPEDVTSDWAMTPEECRKAVSSVLKGKILIGHGLQNDLDAIGITHPWCDVRDTATYAPFMRTCTVDDEQVLRPRKLRDLAWEDLGRQIQTNGEAHCPIDDARAALGLYKSARMEWERVVMDQVNATARESDRKKIVRRKKLHRGGGGGGMASSLSLPPHVQHCSTLGDPLSGVALADPPHSQHLPPPMAARQRESLPRFESANGYSPYGTIQPPFFRQMASAPEHQFYARYMWQSEWTGSQAATSHVALAAPSMKWNQRVHPLGPTY